MKGNGKTLEPVGNYSNMTRVHHDWLKLSFFIKRHWFSDAWKISSDLDQICWVGKWKNIPERKALKGIKMKSGRLQKITNMSVEYSKLSFFINGDWFGQFRKVSSNSGRLFKLSKFRQMKESIKILEPQVNYRNMPRVNHDWLKLTFLMKRHWFGDLWKISSDLDELLWVSKWTNIPQRKALKRIKVKSGRLRKITNICEKFRQMK